jgi:Trp operon repressor
MSSSDDSSGSNSSIQTVKFDGNDFSLWKMKMIGLLLAKDLLDVVINPVDSKVYTSGSKLNKDETELSRKSKKAYGVLLLALGPEQLRLVQQVVVGDANSIWKVLLDNYERKSMATRVQLYEILFSIKMMESESINLYVARLTELDVRLKQQQENLSEGVLLYILLKGLLGSYTTVVQLLKMNENLGFQDVVEKLRNEEERQKVSKKVGGGYVPKSNGIDNQISLEASSVSARTSASRSTYRCYTCGEKGHIKYDCPYNKSRERCDHCKRVGHSTSNCKDEHALRSTIPGYRQTRNSDDD